VKCRIDSLDDWISQSQKNTKTKVSVCWYRDGSPGKCVMSKILDMTRWWYHHH
jgi:hypothetical protein